MTWRAWGSLWGFSRPLTASHGPGALDGGSARGGGQIGQRIGAPPKPMAIYRSLPGGGRRRPNIAVFFHAPNRTLALCDRPSRAPFSPRSPSDTAPRYATQIPHDFPAISFIRTHFDAFRHDLAQSNISNKPCVINHLPTIGSAHILAIAGKCVAKCERWASKSQPKIKVKALRIGPW
jgi:hypothetical protein